MCSKFIYLAFLVILSIAGFVKGSCLEYGHSCWGAHGKRSGGKIYRSIDGSESQQSEGSRDIPLTQDKVKPSELLSILLDRNGRVNLDEARNAHDLSVSNNENENMLDASEQRLRRKLKDAFRKGFIFHYLPKAISDSNVGGVRSSTETTTVRRNQNLPSSGSSNDFYQFDNYPSINLEAEYMDLK